MFLKHMHAKEHMVMLLKNLYLLIQTLMMWIIYSMMLLKIVERNIFIHLNIDMFMISNLRILRITKKCFINYTRISEIKVSILKFNLKKQKCKKQLLYI